MEFHLLGERNYHGSNIVGCVMTEKVDCPKCRDVRVVDHKLCRDCPEPCPLCTDGAGGLAGGERSYCSATPCPCPCHNKYLFRILDAENFELFRRDNLEHHRDLDWSYVYVNGDKAFCKRCCTAFGRSPHGHSVEKLTDWLCTACKAFVTPGMIEKKQHGEINERTEGIPSTGGRRYADSSGGDQGGPRTNESGSGPGCEASQDHGESCKAYRESRCTGEDSQGQEAPPASFDHIAFGGGPWRQEYWEIKDGQEHGKAEDRQEHGSAALMRLSSTDIGLIVGALKAYGREHRNLRASVLARIFAEMEVIR